MHLVMGQRFSGGASCVRNRGLGCLGVPIRYGRERPERPLSARLDREPIVLSGSQPGEPRDRDHGRIVGAELDAGIVHAAAPAADGFGELSRAAAGWR